MREHYGNFSPDPSEPEDRGAPAEFKLTVRGSITETSTTDDEFLKAFDNFRRALYSNGLKGFNGRGVERFGSRLTFNSIWRPHELTRSPIQYLLSNLKNSLEHPAVARYSWEGQFAITHENGMIPKFLLVTIKDNEVTYQEARLEYGEVRLVT